MKCSNGSPIISISPAELLYGIDEFILRAEILLPTKTEDEAPATAGVIPALICLRCGKAIVLSGELDGELWLIHKDEEGVDLDDPMIATLLRRIRRQHPEWLVKTSCAYCHDEIVPPHDHRCPHQKKSPRATRYQPGRLKAPGARRVIGATKFGMT